MPERFICEAVLRDGKRLLIRPFREGDVDALWDFFQRLPTGVRRLAWDDIWNRSVVENWARTIDYGKVLPLLAFDGGKVVADATMHRRKGSPLRLVGRLKWLIEPEYRERGLGTLLVNRFITIARNEGLRHLTCMLVDDIERDAIEVLCGLGFTKTVLPGYGTDPDGNQHDMTKMILKL
jgi:GNAT superfamily N-acetyltransferase